MLRKSGHSLAELAACAERELKIRRRVYPTRVSTGRMSQQLASREISLMEEIQATLLELAEVEEAAERLL